ncbi:alginate export family protein [Pedobacter sp. AW31-3R]|uniref:alginate export family protein n=1 Tax=Pedobacter sp. AW31-3R TaxID=3445781 RepID=UPI003F9F6C74
MPQFSKPKILLFLLLGLLKLSIADAQSFKLMRYDEDYSALRDSSSGFYNRIKFVPLNKEASAYVSFGGEARLEYVAFDNEDWGRTGIGHNNFLLQRYDIHADLHLGSRVRIFGQMRSALQGGRKNGSRPIDKDAMNVQNLFVDFVPYSRGDQKITLRVGRQEIDYGSGRLVSVREGPNARLYFTGAKLKFAAKNLSVDAFVMYADTINPGRFDNTRSKELNLWGSYARIILPESANLDVYYLGIRRNESVFEEGAGQERRHTVGTRIWKEGGGFIYNFEGAYQFGTFASGNIRAWTASAELGYSFENAALKPKINLRNDYISGDANSGDGRLGTFNPLYPKGGYFGFNPQIGPVNLIDIHPYASLNLSNALMVQLDVVFNWRYALQDGVYRPSGTFNLPGSSSSKRYIGTGYLASAVYSLNKFLNLNVGIQYFDTGAFINDIIPDAQNGLFINTRIAFKF